MIRQTDKLLAKISKLASGRRSAAHRREAAEMMWAKQVRNESNIFVTRVLPDVPADNFTAPFSWRKSLIFRSGDQVGGYSDSSFENCSAGLLVKALAVLLAYDIADLFGL